MGTRARIVIKDENKDLLLHCNWDGYPTGIGYEMKMYLKSLKKWSVDDIFTGLFQNKNINNDMCYKDRLWPVTSDISTEDYVYIIDTNKKTLRCYVHEIYYSMEETCVQKNRRYIRKN